jgi:hypothetical protein
MDLDNKILKYKVKKKKMANKIDQLIRKKKQEQYDTLTKIFNEQNVFSEIINQITAGNTNIFIIVYGYNFVGKSIFIEHIEKYFGISNTILKSNIKLAEESNILDKIMDNIQNKKIVYIETNPDLIEQIYKLIYNQTEISKQVYVFYIIPENVLLYRNRLISKLFGLITNTLNTNSILTSNFVDFIKKIFLRDDLSNIYDNMINKFEKLINKFPLSDDDFDFLNGYIEKSYDDIIRYKSNIEFNNLNCIKI